MSVKRSIPLILLILIGLLTSACGSGQPMNMSWSGLSVSSDSSVAYLANGLHIYAVNTADGTQLWKFPAEANASAAFYATPVLSQDGTQLLIGDYGNVFHSLDPKTGTENWKYEQIQGRIVGSPLATADSIYVPSTDTHLYALTLQGQFRWSFKASHALWAQPVTDGKLIYVASMDHFIYAIDPQNGAEKWKLDLGAAIYAAPLLDNNILYVGTLGNKMLAVDLASQKISWSYETTGGIWGTPVIKDGIVIFGDTVGTVYFLKAKEGVEASPEVPHQDMSFIAGPALTSDGVLFATEEGSLIGMDIKGAELYRPSVVGKVYTTPIVINDSFLVAVTSGDHALAMKEKTNGQKWQNFVAK